MIDIEYLNNYLPGIELIQEVNDYSDKIPYSWAEILRSHDQKFRKLQVIETWAAIFSNEELSNTIQFMENYLEEIHLVKTEDNFSLIYVYQIEDEIFYREGRNAKCMTNNSVWDSELQKVSEHLMKFYSDLHDGWFEPESESMGLLPSEDFFAIGSQEWDIFDEIDSEKDFNKVIAMFSNGGGGYLCLDFNTIPVSALIWWHDEQPDSDLNLFDVLDEWIVIGFE